MAFFDDLTKKIGSAADKAADKAKDMAEIGKLSLNISAAEKQLQDLYAQVGKDVYEAENGNAESPYQGTFTKIRAVLADLERLNQQLAVVRTNKDDVIDIEPKVDTPTGEGNICPVCGAAVAPESKFCSACGALL